jgi:crossover junction endodeoxyribonuclease RuvC
MFDQAYTVLGIDPGLTRCGYAVISMQSSQSFVARAMGVIRTHRSDDIADRLAQLHADVESLLREFEPDAVAVEQVFFQNNVRTAMSVGQASGVVLALGRLRGCDVAQYTPSQVKDSIAGWGGAGKEQVQKMVQVRLGLSVLPSPADAADAAAVALCHCACTTSLQRRNNKTAQNNSIHRDDRPSGVVL